MTMPRRAHKEFDSAAQGRSATPVKEVLPELAEPHFTQKRGYQFVESAGIFIVLLVGWEIGLRLLDVPAYLFPTPSEIARALANGVLHGAYAYNLAVTLFEIVTGFAAGSLLGLSLGIAMALAPTFDRIAYPYIVSLQTVPKVAIAPLMIVWFGFGLQSKIIIVTFVCMFPVLVNTIAGMRSTDADRLSLVRSMCASRLQVLRYVQLPSALPYIFAGLTTAIILAVIGAIVGEFVGAKAGIGVLILQANFGLDMAGVFALLTLLSVSGVILNFALRVLERRMCFWSGKSTK